MYKLIGLVIIASVLLVGAFFVGCVVGTTVSPLQQPVESNAPASAVPGVTSHA
ncbi:MAG: hypothetical protein ACTH07_05725 [Microbacterium sp.]